MTHPNQPCPNSPGPPPAPGYQSGSFPVAAAQPCTYRRGCLIISVHSPPKLTVTLRLVLLQFLLIRCIACSVNTIKSSFTSESSVQIKLLLLFTLPHEFTLANGVNHVHSMCLPSVLCSDDGQAFVKTPHRIFHLLYGVK